MNILNVGDWFVVNVVVALSLHRSRVVFSPLHQLPTLSFVTLILAIAHLRPPLFALLSYPILSHPIPPLPLEYGSV